MRLASPLPPERRAEVEALLRGTDLTIAAIAARTGLKPGTVRAWNRRSACRPRQLARALGRWPEGRRAALARVCAAPGIDPGDAAEAAGLAREAGAGLQAALGLGPPPARTGEALAPLDAQAARDAPTLRAHLLGHVARQIVAFDAALNGQGGAVVDSARVLRDLGGLKRLFDELAREDAPGEDGEGGADGGGPDLSDQRAEIARRIAGFVGERAPA